MHLVSIGPIPAFGYNFPNLSKTFLHAGLSNQSQHLSQAKLLFANTDITVTVQGQWHLGAALGSRSFAG